MRSEAFLASLALSSLLGTSQETVPSELEVKAAYLVNFAKFAEWPSAAFPDAGSPIIVGVLGRDPFGEILDRVLAGQKAGSRPFKLRRGKRIADMEGCHLLFIAEADRDRVGDALSELRGRNILTVSDSENFASLGGVIGFYVDQKRIRFEVNPQALEKQGLKLSSKLLKLARIVNGGR